MIEIGKMNELVVCGQDTAGYWLKSEDVAKEIFMPKPLAPANVKVGQKLRVFVYPDKVNRLIATPKIPKAVVGEYALLTAMNVQPFGAFFLWGVEKELLVPGNEQKVKVKPGQKCLVRVCLEEGGHRVYGTTKLGQYIQDSKFDISIGDRVKIEPVIREELGYRSIINKKYVGMIYHNEVFRPIKIGSFLDGVVKYMRDDGLVDVSLQAHGFNKLLEAKEKVMQMLKQNHGVSTLHDRSDAQDIRDLLGMSKSSFKSAIGMLYKERRISISKDGIKLLKN